jgi:hypothetical protein
VRKILTCLVIVTLFSLAFTLADGPVSIFMELDASYDIDDEVIIPVYIGSSSSEYPISIFFPDIYIHNDNIDILNFDEASLQENLIYKLSANAVENYYGYSGMGDILELNEKTELFNLIVSPKNLGSVKLSLSGEYSSGVDDEEYDINSQEIPIKIVDCNNGIDDDDDNLLDCADPDCSGKKGPGDSTCCQSHLECSDDNIFTDDYCNNNICHNLEKVCEEGDNILEESCVCNGPLGDVGGICSTACNTNTDCNDDLLCTEDTCSNGACSNEDIENCCISDDNCDDGNVCSSDSCNLVNNQCIFENNENCCNTVDDCNDDNVCTEDQCSVNHACRNLIWDDEDIFGNNDLLECCNEKTDCNDGSVCTLNGVCELGECSYNTDCGDGESCLVLEGQNTGTCVGCISDNNCNDDNVCTEDVCTENNVCSNPDIFDCQVCTQESDCGDFLEEENIYYKGCYEVLDCIAQKCKWIPLADEIISQYPAIFSSCGEDSDDDGVVDSLEPENCVVVGLHDQAGIYVYPPSYTTHAGCQKGDLNTDGCIDLPDYGIFLSLVADYFENSDYVGPGDLSGKNGLDLADYGIFLSAVADYFTIC